MEINGSINNTPMPAMPEPNREPPRDALVSSAVRETQAAEPEAGAGRTGGDGDRDRDDARQSSPGGSSLGNYVDVTV